MGRPHKHEVQEFKGIRYYWKPNGYYAAVWREHGCRYMHRDVWEHHHGPIPQGCHVHHIDGNRSNNAIENLSCVSVSTHNSRHGRDRCARNPEQAKRQIGLAQKAAAEWHGSPEGIEFHRKLGRASWEGRQKVAFSCSWCGKSYLAYPSAVKAGYCSPSCQGMARKKSGVDDEDRKCSICGAIFRCNKYARTKTCSKGCWRKAVSLARRSVQPGD